MNQVMLDIWPYLFTAMLGVIGWLFRKVISLNSKLEVAESAIKSLEAKMNNTIENIEKTIENIQKRQDSHSRKQDEFLEKMNQMEKEVLKQMGTVRSDISALSQNVQNFSNLVLVSDPGIKIKRQQ